MTFTLHNLITFTGLLSFVLLINQLKLFFGTLKIFLEKQLAYSGTLV